jgi:hypothetical protein
MWQTRIALPVGYASAGRRLPADSSTREELGRQHIRPDEPRRPRQSGSATSGL